MSSEPRSAAARSGGIKAAAGCPLRTSRSPAGFVKRTSPSSPTTITPSRSPSRMAERRSRSVASRSKLSRSASRIVSSERVRSPISSLPPAGSGASNFPAAICSALRARRLTRIAISVETTNPTRTPTAIAIMIARTRSPWRSSKARVERRGRLRDPDHRPAHAAARRRSGPMPASGPPIRSARKRRPARPATPASPACSILRRSAGGVASGANGPPRRLIAQTWKVSVLASSRIWAASPFSASAT